MTVPITGESQAKSGSRIPSSELSKFIRPASPAGAPPVVNSSNPLHRPVLPQVQPVATSSAVSTPDPFGRHSTRAGLTLVELLTVVAVISILIGILIPTVSTVRTSARKAKAKIILNQWAAAIETFRQEYGFYPAFSFNGDGTIDTDEESDEFIETLSSRLPDGTQTDPAPAGNTKRISFYTFSEGELNEADHLVDPFGGTLVAVLMDLNYDGIIKVEAGEDYDGWPDIGFGADIPLGFPTNGLRAGVAIYSPGPGGEGNIITTW